tara:strand:+ start:2006 stop:2740 length:735 start_codon:yes stop_codon:yes gene_type:complete
MQKLILWIFKPFLRWVVKGKPIVLLDSNGSVFRSGAIVGIRIEHGEIPEMDIIHHGEFRPTSYKMMKGVRWNNSAKHLEVEADNAVETSRRRHADRVVEGRDDRAGDREAVEETPQHDQGSPSAPGPGAETDGGPHGESEGGVRPGHDEDSPSESDTGRADTPSENPIPSNPRHKGALKLPPYFRMGINDDIPPGVLICAAPDQTLHITRLPGYVGDLPTNSIIWGHTDTVAAIQVKAPTKRLN